MKCHKYQHDVFKVNTIDDLKTWLNVLKFHLQFGSGLLSSKSRLLSTERLQLLLLCCYIRNFETTSHAIKALLLTLSMCFPVGLQLIFRHKSQILCKCARLQEHKNAAWISAPFYPASFSRALVMSPEI